jgi:2-polyprenyl-3-methyl-5-hydroxy-6-metoxy-1,4-benzoquinol methylase
MTAFSSLALRVREDELMDDPQLDPAAHARALRGLTRINRISRSVATIWPRVRATARHGDRPLRVLDLATGAGDLPIGLARRAARDGIPLEIAACDISPRAIAHGRAAAERAGVRVAFFEHDCLAAGIPPGYDVVTCALFLHHLDEADIVRLFSAARAAVGRLLLCDDLRRSRLGLWAAQLGTRLLTRSPIVHTDGARSVRAAFTPTELAELARQAGLDGFTIRPHWPWRQLLAWWRR